MEPLRLGVIGCGVIGRAHIKCAGESEQVNVVAIADVREEALADAASSFSIQTRYTDAEQLLQDPHVEAVVLAMPAHLRTKLALEAFARGKHVLTEKPVAMNAAEVREMLAAKGDLVAGCCSSRFHHMPSAKAVTDIVESGGLGDLRLIRYRAIRPLGTPPTQSPPEWRLKKELNGGGIMMNWGCYDLDYLFGITGWSLKPSLVLAHAWPIAPELAERYVAAGSNAETHAAAMIRCKSGPAITLERGEYVVAEAEETFEILGDRGALRWRMTPQQGKAVIRTVVTPDEGAATETVWEGDEGWSAQTGGVQVDFAEAVRRGHSPRTSLERALLIQELTDALYRSAEEGVAVSLD